MTEITLIALDLCASSNFYKYEKSSVADQLKLLVKQIDRAYVEAKLSHPDSLVIMTWREYGVVNRNGIAKRALSYDEKQFFKATMKELTLYRDLVIVAGSIATEKPSVKIKSVANKVEQTFKTYTKLNFLANGSQFNSHWQKFKMFYQGSKTDNFTAVENTTYIFQNGEQIDKYEKLAPFNEIPTNYPNHLYRINKDYSLIMINSSNSTVSCGIEICFDHANGLLKRHLKRKKIAAPLIQVIESDSVNAEIDKLCGNFVFHVDSRAIHNAVNPNELDTVHFYKKINSKREETVRAYSVNPFENECKLRNIACEEFGTPKRATKRRRLG